MSTCGNFRLICNKALNQIGLCLVILPNIGGPWRLSAGFRYLPLGTPGRQTRGMPSPIFVGRIASFHSVRLEWLRMLVREGDERNETIDLWLACSLAAVAGTSNAAAFYAVGFFSANMTGNVSTLPDHLALGQWTTALFYFAILIAFICGSACSAFLIDGGRPRTRRIYAYAIVVEALVLTAVGGVVLYRALGGYLLILAAAMLFGIAASAITRSRHAGPQTATVVGD